MKSGVWVIAAGLALAAASAAYAENPPGGVYDCFGPSMVTGPNFDVRRATNLNISGAKFSILSPGVYLSRGGKKGHFKFDGHTLNMVDGPYKGINYHKVDGYWTFRMLRENGDEGPFMCPRNTAKDLNKPNAW